MRLNLVRVQFIIKRLHRNYCRKPNGDLKKWIVCPIDGLRYYMMSLICNIFTLFTYNKLYFNQLN